MVEADGQLKLLPTSILDIYKVFGHIGMLSTAVASINYNHLTRLIIWGSGSLVESK
jgi:hypothetical protein